MRPVDPLVESAINALAVTLFGPFERQRVDEFRAHLIQFLEDWRRSEA